jgi:hypothetical protein
MSTSERNVGASGRLTLQGRARGVSFGDDTLVVDLEDGRQISVPLAWFPRLAAATTEQRGIWELIGRGIGIYWPELDEDISVENLLGAQGELLIYAETATEPRKELRGPTRTAFVGRDIHGRFVRGVVEHS